MSKIIDLTYPIKEGMPVFPGDPGVNVISSNYDEGYMVSRVVMGTHTGTHMDAPCHKIPGSHSIDMINLEQLISKALIVRLSMKPNDLITAELLDNYKNDLEGVGCIIFDTGWGKYYDKDSFYKDFPGITEDAVKWFNDHGITIIGLDMPSVHPVEHEKIHDLLLENNIVIVETLNIPENITSKYVEFYAIPLKLQGLDGSPVRAFIKKI